MTGRIIAIEGGDGAGKGTISKALQEHLEQCGARTALVSFPRYNETQGGKAIGDFLSHRVPAPDDPRVTAVLYALDRFESKPFLANLLTTHDYVVVDRYVASNIAYQAAKLSIEERESTARWIEDLEFQKFELPRPELCVLMDMPVELARSLITRKDLRTYTDRTLDRHEEDLGLQQRVVDTYRALARTQMISPWLVIRPSINGTLRNPLDLVLEITSYMRRRLNIRALEVDRSLSVVLPSKGP